MTAAAPDVAEQEPAVESTEEPSVDETPRRIDVRGDKVYLHRHTGFLAWVGRLLRRVIAFLLALLLILLLLGGLVFLGVSAVLKSDLPRSIAQDIAGGLINHDLSLGGVDVGWGGHVEVRDIALRLPSEEGEGQGPLVAEVPRATAELGPLPLVVFKALTGGNLIPDAVSVESPKVYMTQDEDGQWTLPQAAALLTGGGGGGDPNAPATPISLPPLPELDVSDGTVVVRNNQGEERIASGLTVTGGRTTPLVYEADLSIPGVLDVSAELIPASGRNQTVRIKATNPGDLLTPYLGELPASLDLDATWDGAFAADGGVEGTLSFADGSAVTYGQGAEPIALGGAIAVDAIGKNDALVRLDFDGFSANGLPGVGQVLIREGTVVAGDTAVSVDGLLIEVLGGEVLVAEAAFDPAAIAGTVDVDFRGLAPPGQEDTAISGTLAADLWLTEFGEVRAEATLESGGTVAGRTVEQFSAAAKVYGDGYENFETLDVSFSVPERIIVAGGAGETTPLPPFEGLVKVRLEDDNPYVELAQFDALEAKGTFKAHGRFYLPQPEDDLPAYYGLWIEGTGWPVALPRMEQPLPLDLGGVLAGAIGEGEGTGEVSIGNVYGSYGDIRIAGEGGYLFDDPDGLDVLNPLRLDLFLVRETPPPPPPAGDPDGLGDGDELRDIEFDDPLEARVIVRDEPDAAFPPDATGGQLADEQDRFASADRAIRGGLRSTLTVLGDPLEPRLFAAGDVRTRGFAIGPYELGDLRAALQATVADDRLGLMTTGAQVLGADLRVVADVPFAESEPGVVRVDVDGLDLARLTDAAGLNEPAAYGEPEAEPLLTGTVDVEGLTLQLQGFDPNKVRGGGTVRVRDVAAAGVGSVADRVTIRPVLAGGVLTAPIRVEREADLPRAPAGLMDDADVAAAPDTIELVAEYDLANGDRVAIRDLSADAYPILLDADALGGDLVGAAELTLQSDRLLVRFGESAQPQGEEAFALPLLIDGRLRAGLHVLTGEARFDLSTLLAAEVAVTARGREVAIDDLRGELPGIGALKGGGKIALVDVPGQSDLWVHSTLRLAPLAERLELPRGGAGELDVAISVRPGPGDRPRGDVLLDVGFEGRRARWRSMDIDRGQIVAYLSRPDRPDGTSVNGPYDFTLLSTDRVRLFAGGGRVDGYLKVRDRGADNGGRFVIGNLLVDDVQLAQIGPILLEKDDVEGDVDLRVNAYGPIGVDDGVAAFSGDGRITVDNGRLASFDLIQAILEATRFIPTQTRDELEANFRLEAGDLYATGARVFTSGVEVRGNFEVNDLIGGEVKPIDGTVIVLAKPLAAFNLPLFAEATEVLDAIQSQGTALDLGGTLDRPQAVPAALGDLGEAVGALIGR